MATAKQGRGDNGPTIHNIGNGAGGINVRLFLCALQVQLSHSVRALNGIYQFTDLPQNGVPDGGENLLTSRIDLSILNVLQRSAQHSSLYQGK